MGCNQEIDWENLRTPEQQTVMAQLGSLLSSNLVRGATPYTGAINAPYDPSQLAAMNVMMGLGGQGQYNAPEIPLYGGGNVGVGPAVYADYYTGTDASTNTNAAANLNTNAGSNLDTVPNPIDPVVGPELSPGAIPDVGPQLVPNVGPVGPLGPTPTTEPLPGTNPLGVEVSIYGGRVAASLRGTVRVGIGVYGG